MIAGAAYALWTAAVILLPFIVLFVLVSAAKDRHASHLALGILLLAGWGLFFALWIIFSIDVGVFK